jgi:integrase
MQNVLSQIWDISQGKIYRSTLEEITDYYMNRYPSDSGRDKFFNYTRAFLKYLYKIHTDNFSQSLYSLFEKPRRRREIKLMTSRIMVTEDIQAVIKKIQDSPLTAARKPNWKQNYIATTLFLAYTGQRPMTAAKITVGQFKMALLQDPPVLTVEASQDKIRMAHYVPLHPVLIPHITELIPNRKDRECMFSVIPMQTWLSKYPVRLHRTKGHLVLKDIRKFTEQKSDEIGFTDANKCFMMSHGVSSINWTNYKAFLPENVYARYMECWKDVKICPSLSL